MNTTTVYFVHHVSIPIDIFHFVQTIETHSMEAGGDDIVDMVKIIYLASIDLHYIIHITKQSLPYTNHALLYSTNRTKKLDSVRAHPNIMY